MTYKIGILGLGVMGRSLGLNLHRNGIPVVGFDPAPKVDADYRSPKPASICTATESCLVPASLSVA